jgi:hypothetical protein
MRVKSELDLPPQVRQQVRDALYRNGAPAPVRSPKFRNERCEVDGKSFPSKLEARCYGWLTQRKAAGDVAFFLRQVPFELEGGIVYRLDFLVVLTGTGGVELIEAKGYDTQVGRNKRKQVLDRYGVQVQLWPPRKKR